MPTIRQLVKRPRKPRVRKIRSLVLFDRPVAQAIVTKFCTVTPKKPNSALRKIAKCRIKFIPSARLRRIRPYLFVGQEAKSKFVNATAYTPSESVELGAHAQILLIGDRRKDLPGIKFRAAIVKCKQRATRRSKVGQPRPKKVVKK